MSQETTDNFWQVFNNLPPVEVKPIFYRLYHDNDGNMLFYSMEDVPGLYIEIDHATYSASSGRVKVKDGKLIKIDIKNSITKLIPNVNDGVCCDTRNISIVVDQTVPHVKWKLKTHE